MWQSLQSAKSLARNDISWPTLSACQHAWFDTCFIKLAHNLRPLFPFQQVCQCPGAKLDDH